MVVYTCPVCGYNELQHPPADWTICPCCGTMFGYSDVSWGVDLLREEWVKNGMQWHSKQIKPPDNWSPVEQLRSIVHKAS